MGHHGALLVGQSGGGTAVINASLAGIVERAQALGVETVLGMLHGVEGLLSETFIDLTKLDPASLSGLLATPSGALGLCRYKLRDVDELHAVEALRRWDVRWLVYIGGNDSALTAHRLRLRADELGHVVSVVSVPKTIDNDLLHTDHSPGFGTAAKFVAHATRGLGLDAWAMRTVDQVRILELYGRDTGWLTAASALARERPGDPPHVVLPPEQPFDPTTYLTAVESALRRHGFAVVVVGEMLRDGDGVLVGSDGRGVSDSFGNHESRRPGVVLQSLVERELGLRAKYDRPGSLQKVTSWSYSEVDVSEALEVGRAAVDAAVAGKTGSMVALERLPGPAYASRTCLVDVESVIEGVKPVAPSFLDPVRLDVTDPFLDYARPLLGEPLPPVVRLADLPRALRPVHITNT